MTSDRDLEPLSDEELVSRAKAGQLAAFQLLATRHERTIYTIARRLTDHEHDAEDVTQQAFLSALENLHAFRGEASFSTWLRRIATHAALKILRKRQGLPTVSLEQNTLGDEDQPIPHPEFIADWRLSPEELVGRREIRKLLENALESLEEKYRVVFLLRDLEGFSVRETAQMLGLSESNVKIRLLRARLHLREQLTRSLGEPSRRVFPQHDHKS